MRAELSVALSTLILTAPLSAEADEVLVFDLQSDADDGTEKNDTTWYSDGPDEDDLNRMGSDSSNTYDMAFRFHLDGVSQGASFVYARLVLPGAEGEVGSAVSLRIRGVDADSVSQFSGDNLPSDLPETTADVDWSVSENWPDAELDVEAPCKTMPLRRYTPNIATIINEILARENWNEQEATLALVIEDNESTGTNYLTAYDYYRPAAGCDYDGPTLYPTLELYPDVASTFVGSELLE